MTARVTTKSKILDEEHKNSPVMSTNNSSGSENSSKSNDSSNTNRIRMLARFDKTKSVFYKKYVSKILKKSKEVETQT